MNLVLLGPPGAGKGTQAQRIRDRYGVTHISTGDLFREAVSGGSALGEKVKSYLDSGALVPDEVVIEVVLERISRDDCKSGWMLDGFPRTTGQAEALDKALESEGKQLDAVVEIRVDDDELVGRLTGRRTCGDCGKIYNLKHVPPKQEGICDVCGGELTQRSDDREEAIRQRLEKFHEQTAPLTPHYEAQGILKTAVGTGKQPDDVSAQIWDALG